MLKFQILNHLIRNSNFGSSNSYPSGSIQHSRMVPSIPLDQRCNAIDTTAWLWRNRCRIVANGPYRGAIVNCELWFACGVVGLDPGPWELKSTSSMALSVDFIDTIVDIWVSPSTFLREYQSD